MTRGSTGPPCQAQSRPAQRRRNRRQQAARCWLREGNHSREDPQQAEHALPPPAACADAAASLDSHPAQGPTHRWQAQRSCPAERGRPGRRWAQRGSVKWHAPMLVAMLQGCRVGTACCHLLLGGPHLAQQPLLPQPAVQVSQRCAQRHACVHSAGGWRAGSGQLITRRRTLEQARAAPSSNRSSQLEAPMQQRLVQQRRHVEKYAATFPVMERNAAHSLPLRDAGELGAEVCELWVLVGSHVALEAGAHLQTGWAVQARPGMDRTVELRERCRAAISAFEFPRGTGSGGEAPTCSAAVSTTTHESSMISCRRSAQGHKRRVLAVKGMYNVRYASSAANAAPRTQHAAPSKPLPGRRTCGDGCFDLSLSQVDSMSSTN